ncbi:MAG: hypothetical protein JSW17_03530 [Candidatus Omnitrophota bacterium]|nr:MAG: hypothetical protein JSW17_03530 [Candidatus Omnitrophota bacterium]
MEKDSDFISSYAYLDSQRLKETFFSSKPQQEEEKKKKSKRPSIFFVMILVVALLIAVFSLLFYRNYEFILIPRPALNAKPDIPSVLDEEILSSLVFLGQNSKPLLAKPWCIQLETGGVTKTGIRINLKRPVNLRTHSLYLIAKKIPSSSKIGIVLRDARFFSNWRQPCTIEINAQEQSVIKIPLSYEEAALKNINLSRINQISLYFYPLTYSDATEQIVIKDIVLMEKEEI